MAGTPRCRLFLVAPDGLAADRLSELVAAALAAGDVASLVVPPERQAVAAAVAAARPYEAAVLVRDDTRLAARHKADGVHLSAGDAAAIAEARAALGADAVVGAAAAASRHAAMSVGEAGADYMAIVDAGPAGLEIVKWWAELFEVPCVALAPVDAATARPWIAAGADFIRPDDAMWRDPAAARAAVAALNAAIAEVLG